MRFTCKENTLYAITLGRPNTNKLTIKTLGTDTSLSSKGIEAISLLGSNKKIPWSRPNDIALAFAITVKGKLEK
ncbi:MAG: alpha-L-fucosidase C-terminal domain-containing protein [Planctomycetota bacterium]